MSKSILLLTYVKATSASRGGISAYGEHCEQDATLRQNEVTIRIIRLGEPSKKSNHTKGPLDQGVSKKSQTHSQPGCAALTPTHKLVHRVQYVQFFSSPRQSSSPQFCRDCRCDDICETWSQTSARPLLVSTRTYTTSGPKGPNLLDHVLGHNPGLVFQVNLRTSLYQLSIFIVVEDSVSLLIHLEDG